MDVREYVRKVWYHQQAARLGEYVALTLVDLLLAILPETEEPDERTDASHT